MKKPRIMFVPADANNEQFFQQFQNSLRKFHSPEELPLMRFDNPNPADKDYFYRAKPIIAQKLIEEYEVVIGADCDQVVCGSLEELWATDEFDVAVVHNDPSYPLNVWDIDPTRYANNGIVVLKSKEFIDHWHKLCFSPHFNNYQFREQDLLNILISDYHNYNVKYLEEDNIYGESAKPLWAQATLEGDKIMIKEKELKIIHFGGGNDPNKGNFQIRFQPEVVERIKWLIK